jgi:solute carrier family 30 (zinc transporter), member 2
MTKFLTTLVGRVTRKLYIAMGLCFLFMMVELVGGIVGHSLAIITDALHMLTDVFSFALAIYAAFASKQKATTQFTYGYPPRCWSHLRFVDVLLCVL